MTLFLRALIIVTIVSACTPRGVITLHPDTEVVGQIRSIFIGTTRGMDAKNGFSSKRATNISFHRYDISVPPQHKVGEVTWPRGKPDPQTDFFTTGIDHFTSAGNFSADLSKALRKHPRGRREVVIFVHGFNTNFAEGLYRFAQISNDMGLPNPTVHYSWPSLGKTLGYEYDRDSALFARDGLEKLLHSIRSAGADQILLVGHSMGALLTVETLRQMSIDDSRGLNRLISGVVLISPDIDVELFRQQATRIDPMPQPFVIFTSQKDRALRLSALLTGNHKRLGSVRDINELANLEVTLIDVSKFSHSFVGHFSEATSPALLKILKQLNDVNTAFQNDRSATAGLIPGTILTVRKATKILLSPVVALEP